MNNDLELQLQAEEKAFLDGYQSEEFLEGVAAFGGKRKPVFNKS